MGEAGVQVREAMQERDWFRYTRRMNFRESEYVHKI